MSFKAFINYGVHINDVNIGAIEPLMAHRLGGWKEAWIGKRCIHDVLQVRVNVRSKHVVVVAAQDVSNSNVHESLLRADVAHLSLQEVSEPLRVIQTTFSDKSLSNTTRPIVVKSSV